VLQTIRPGSTDTPGDPENLHLERTLALQILPLMTEKPLKDNGLIN
jgi:hypothetical protein